MTSPDAAFVFRLCQAPGCGLRFPAGSADTQAARCPRCGAATAVPGLAEAARVATVAAGTPVTPLPPTPPARLLGLLDNIRSLHNVGSMFRTADGAGVGHLFLGGLTATPAQPRLAKAALGAQQSVPWSAHHNGAEIAAALQQAGYPVWALETTATAEPGLPSAVPPAPVATPPVLVVGHERAGIDPAILAQCQRVFRLPMVGHKASLNAAVAWGIAVYALLFGRPAPDPDAGPARRPERGS